MSCSVRSLRVFSTFSGIGGFEYGIQKAFQSYTIQYGQGIKGSKSSGVPHGIIKQLPTGRWNKFNCVGYSEFSKYPAAVYKYHWPEAKNWKDITKIKEKDLPDFDFLVGGPPCQPFSTAGSRLGFEDTRGTLFFDLCRILKAKKPRFFLLENVKGLISHDSGRTFKTIVASLVECGYCVEWQVFNSKFHRVPQNRERIYFAGYLGGPCSRQVFPIRQTGELLYEFIQKELSDEIVQEGRDMRDTDGLLPQDGQNRSLCAGVGIHALNNPTHSNDRVYSVDGISSTLNAMEGGRRQPKVAIKTCQGTEENKRIRRLTPIECARLQGFPDTWCDYGRFDDGSVEKISDTQKYHAMGNAVTTTVVEDIMLSFIPLMNEIINIGE